MIDDFDEFIVILEHINLVRKNCNKNNELDKFNDLSKFKRLFCKHGLSWNDKDHLETIYDHRKILL